MKPSDVGFGRFFLRLTACHTVTYMVVGFAAFVINLPSTQTGRSNDTYALELQRRQHSADLNALASTEWQFLGLVSTRCRAQFMYRIFETVDVELRECKMTCPSIV